MTDKELMQEVLEAMESLHRTGDTQVFDMCAAPVLIPALRERLAQPEKVMAEYKFQTYAAYKTDGEMKIGVVPETRPATREEKIVNHGVYEVRSCAECGKSGGWALYCVECMEKLAQPEQEPVAWIWKDGTVTTDPDQADGTWTPLYTTPPQRTWVGLTDEEIEEINVSLNGKRDLARMFARAIEDKLKEKNT